MKKFDLLTHKLEQIYTITFPNVNLPIRPIVQDEAVIFLQQLLTERAFVTQFCQGHLACCIRHLRERELFRDLFLKWIIIFPKIFLAFKQQLALFDFIYG